MNELNCDLCGEDAEPKPTASVGSTDLLYALKEIKEITENYLAVGVNPNKYSNNCVIFLDNSLANIVSVLEKVKGI